MFTPDWIDMTRLANGPEMILPLLGIEGLPKHLISFELRCKGNGLVEIQCEFHIEQTLLHAIEESWKPVLADYVLVAKDSIAPANTAQTATENVAGGVANA